MLDELFSTCKTEDLGEAFFWASLIGNFEKVKCIVENGVDIHGGHDAALKTACRHGHLKIVKYLIEHGADVNAQSYECLGHSVGYASIIVKDVAVKNSSHYGHLEVVKYLLDHGANRDAIQDEKTLKYLNWIDKVKNKKASIIQKWWRN